MFYLPKGTIIKVKGMPFELLEETPVDGREENYNLALSHSETLGCKLIQAASTEALQTKSASS